MRVDRLAVIKKIINDKVIRNQEELQAELKACGSDVTQATLSRDLRELGILKVHDSVLGYCYRLPDSGKTQQIISRNSKFTVETIKSVEFSGMNAVIKTYPGFAAAVASVIDENVSVGIMGTLAGDDTVLLILRENADRNYVMAAISRFIPGFESKLK